RSATATRPEVTLARSRLARRPVAEATIPLAASGGEPFGHARSAGCPSTEATSRGTRRSARWPCAGFARPGVTASPLAVPARPVAVVGSPAPGSTRGSGSLGVTTRSPEARLAPASVSSVTTLRLESAAPASGPARATGARSTDALARRGVCRRRHLPRVEDLVVLAGPTVPPRRQERRRLGDRPSRGDRLHPLDLLRGERPELTRLQTRDGDPGLSRAEEAHHRVPDRGAEPLHQMRPSLAHLEDQPGVPLRRLEALGTE